MRSLPLRLAAFLLAASAAPCQSQFWGELKPGRFPVGFRAAYQLDPARAYDSGYPLRGAIAPASPRPVFIAVWYPAAAPHDTAMGYRDYFRALTGDSAASDFAQRLRRFTRDAACRAMLGKDYEKLTDEERAAWEGALATPVFATLDVPAAEGKYPVVIYHPGASSTFEENAVLCEFLASHGYVVLSSAYQSPDSSHLNIEADLATSLADMSVLLRYAATLPFANAGRAAAIGHDFGAQAAMAWRTRHDSPLQAVVALDSSLVYLPLDRFGELRALLERYPESPCPVLIFGDRKRNARFEGFDPYLRFAASYRATTVGLEHAAYLSQSYAARPDGVPADYRALCDAILRFLDGHLKNNREALAPLQSAAGPIAVEYRPPAAATPPTPVQVARIFSSGDPARLDALASLVKDTYYVLAVDAANLMIADGRTREAAGLLQWAVPLAPTAADLQRALGRTLALLGDKAGARKAYEKSLYLLADDGTLDSSQKLVTRHAVEAGLTALLKSQ
jgi:dienelactone hydrolase